MHASIAQAEPLARLPSLVPVESARSALDLISYRTTLREQCPNSFVISGILGVSAVIFLGSCGQWKCKVCGRRKAWRFVGIARAGCDLATERIRVLTLTAPREDPAVSWAQLGPRWHKLCERLARRLGRRISYFAAVELQQRGNVHMHVLMRDTGYIPKPMVHALGYESGFGFSDIRQVNSASGVKYVTKYLTKSAGQLMPKGVRRVRMSQDWYERPKQPSCVWGEGWKWEIWDAVDPDFVERRLRGDGVLSVHRLDVEVCSDE